MLLIGRQPSVGFCMDGKKGRLVELDDGIRTHRCVPRNCWSGSMVNVQGFEMLQLIGRRELRQ